MKIILILSSFLVYALALPTYETNPIVKNDPETYKNIEILILESAVDQDGGYSYSFENDDGSRVAQDGEHRLVDEGPAIETIRGSYSYNDDKGQPVSLTYTADENGFRPMGAHLPTPPPIPAEILASLKFLATAKPFVDDQLYDYKPKKKVFRGHQYSARNGVARSRNIDRSTDFTDTILESTPDDEVSLKSANIPEAIETKTTDESLDVAEEPISAVKSLKSAEIPKAIETKTTDESLDVAEEQTSAVKSLISADIPEAIETKTTDESLDVAEEHAPPVQSTRISNWDAFTEAKKKIDIVVKETIDKTSKITQAATSQTASSSLAAIQEEVAKVTDGVNGEIIKFNEATGSSAQAPSTSNLAINERPNGTVVVKGRAIPSSKIVKEFPGPVEDPQESSEISLSA